MPKIGTADDTFLDPLPATKKAKRGRQEDGTYITSDGTVLPAKENKRRDPYPEPEECQVEGHAEVVGSPDGKVSFLAQRMDDVAFRNAGFPNRKRQDLRYAVVEVYSGQPRTHYSYDELVQIRNGEIKK